MTSRAKRAPSPPRVTCRPRPSIERLFAARRTGPVAASRELIGRFETMIEGVLAPGGGVSTIAGVRQTAMRISAIHTRGIGPLGSRVLYFRSDWSGEVAPAVPVSGPNGCGS
jgi:hypothetical protein